MTWCDVVKSFQECDGKCGICHRYAIMTVDEREEVQKLIMKFRLKEKEVK